MTLTKLVLLAMLVAVVAIVARTLWALSQSGRRRRP